MSLYQITHKMLLELRFWAEEKARDGYAAERAKLRLYMDAFGLSRDLHGTTNQKILEIGTGPYWGLLQYLRDWPSVERCVAVDALFPALDACGLLEDRNGILRVDEPFEHWETNDQFDAIMTCNALDHGEMGFYLIPKMWRMLRPGGRLYIHVHLRPPDLLNLLHDHSLTEDQLDKHLSYTDLVQKHRKIYEHDVDGEFCRTLVGIWSKPL